jgi:hypothetical protein
VAGSFTVTRAANSAGALTIALTWSGTATAGADYSVTAAGATLSTDRSTLTLASGAASATLTVTPVADTVVEGTETVAAHHRRGERDTPSGRRRPRRSRSRTAPSPGPAISVRDASITEGDRGTSTVAVTLTLSAASATAVSVTVATAAAGTGTGYATAGSDYTAATSTVSFAAGATTATFTVTILNDRIREGNEIFRVVLTNPSGGATIATGTATVTIVDNESALTATAAGTGAEAVESGAVEAVLDDAIARWTRAGVAPESLADVVVELADLDGSSLAVADGNVILLDRDAAGWGWHTDPRSPVEAGRIDLLTVLLHELGHVAGHDHEAHGVMAPALAPGVRVLALDAPEPAAAPLRTAPRRVRRVTAAARFRRAAPSNACGPPERRAGPPPLRPPVARRVGLELERRVRQAEAAE